jgi:holo-[acyl-carrier protein] synthase
MVIGIGLDLVETGRVARLLDRYGDRFVAKLMDPEEAGTLPQEGAKEAASKALGTGWSHGVRWRDVVLSAEPEAGIRLDGRAAEVAAGRGSSGRTRVRVEIAGEHAIGEVWLLS